MEKDLDLLQVSQCLLSQHAMLKVTWKVETPDKACGSLAAVPTLLGLGSAFTERCDNCVVLPG